ncbi:MAG: TlpA family protein disulfide reductase [Gemmatimonadaceae bacterium]|jgi:peroxiredoxin|nr:TlpA family protein disulfide reductase [Gemmatimonadaceae bacterium]MCC6431874.1 TlpA family protein disulfide reductase [Gemmatimonadaceae bacterium]
MRRCHRAPRSAALIAVAMLSLSSCTSTEQRGAIGAEGDGRVEVGYPAPAYATVSLDGDSVSLAAQRGKVVLLNVWATWCHPCRTEIPELRAIHAKYQAQGLELVGVSVDTDGTDDAIRSFMREFQMTFPIWRDPDERVSTKFLVVGVPATFLIDREGVLRWRKTGPIAPGDTTLTAAIQRALGS